MNPPQWNFIWQAAKSCAPNFQNAITINPAFCDELLAFLSVQDCDWLIDDEGR